MFYPGDPTEERKRQLIARLSGQRRGGAGGFGQRVARAPGFFGRGQMFGGNAGQGVAQRLASFGGGQAAPQPFQVQGFGGGGPGSFIQDNGQYFNDMVPPSAFPSFQPPQMQPQPHFDPAVLKSLIGGYGMPSGFGRTYY